MTELRRPKHIVCAVRGGPESRETVTRAVTLALEHGARLTFFHVMDAEFLEYATIGPLSVVHRELEEMGKFTMLILCDRARRRGVQQVDYEVREGNIRRQLLGFARETEADLMVMGCPRRSPGRNVFRPEEFPAFVTQMEEEGGFRVVTVPALAEGEA
ncbi:MAG: universal stress protein [Anaerolineae bacterium]|nr:universal stress protein [Anaerolineae bacterium]